MEKISKKLVVIGDAMCGKTCLLSVICGKEFSEYYVSSFLETEVDGKQVELALWDTAGQEDCDRLRTLSYPDMNVILMCFSVDNPNSLENIPKKWVPEVKNFCPNVSIILVANKKDLRNNENIDKELARKLVRTEDGQAMAIRISTYEYLEYSAKTNDGVKELSQMASRAAVQKRRGASGKCSSGCKLL
ncbi:hypothetical protein GDO78_002139 [Eleutherodactylus coqui]|uniref:Uncharacterized protein n=1 Tax=Eleutherodactylus coqui TaxID=57060 RepID=A0A8J6FVF1_ELECQ|nr:hypothetical protein GDO78_002139 [Eleutherodactylus coqui]